MSKNDMRNSNPMATAFRESSQDYRGTKAITCCVAEDVANKAGPCVVEEYVDPILAGDW